MIVEVADTGAGMDEETRKHCLEPFFTTQGERGTGLGPRFMVYGVIQRHSADVEVVESAPRQGHHDAAVGFPCLSLMLSTGFQHPGRAGDGLSTVPPRLRILAVDDDPVVIQSIRHTLEGDGHLVTSANDGREGIETFTAALERNEPFAVVITDLGMPYVDGRQVAGTVKKLSPGTPVILLTGWGQRLIAGRGHPARSATACSASRRSCVRAAPGRWPPVASSPAGAAWQVIQNKTNKSP